MMPELILKKLTVLLLIFFLCLIAHHEVISHGRLIEPPSRSSAWRYGFNTTANYNDHELYCGGFSRQYQKNNGKCGICGDAYDLPQPRPNEAGGVYGQGVLVRKYRINSVIRIKVELTANHRGFFEFRLCPNNNPKKIATQKCLDTYILQQSNGDGTKYYPSEGAKVFESRYLLPRELTCTQCVLQWRYVAGNNWGECADGTQGVGCGPQEEFRACADVSITDSSGHASSDEDNTLEDNEIHRQKQDEDQTQEKASDGSSVWPFAIIMIALILAALGFAIIFGWFYRNEVLEFTRNTLHKPNWKLGNYGFGSSSPGRPTATMIYPPPEIISGRPLAPLPPVPPPRNKKSSSNNPQYASERHYNDLNNSRRVITPDIISEPMSVTINGIAV